MNNKYYTFKDILYGLRHEYMINEERLTKLKKCIDIKKEDYDKFSFYLCKINPLINTMLICDTGYYRKNITYPYYNYKIAYNNHDKNSFNINNIDKFNNILNTIITSKFANFIFIDYIELQGYLSTYELNINLTNINLYLKEGKYPNTTCIYYPKYDTVSIQNNKISDELINYIFNIKFPKNIFPKYHKEIIESSNILSKKLEIEDISSTFKLEENEKKLILKK
ncbi:MAG: hypothetical protein IJZ36_04965 [Bacilli bacterium]|nr:hypothetical protein [Bacilli bacterium]